MISKPRTHKTRSPPPPQLKFPKPKQQTYTDSKKPRPPYTSQHHRNNQPTLKQHSNTDNPHRFKVKQAPTTKIKPNHIAIYHIQTHENVGDGDLRERERERETVRKRLKRHKGKREKYKWIKLFILSLQLMNNKLQI